MTVKLELSSVNDARTPQEKQKRIGILKDTLAKSNTIVAGLEYKAGGRRQEDASEFLIPLFDELYDKSPLTEISRITLLEKSDEYKTKPEKSDPKKTIELEIGNGESMSVLLGNFQKEEAMNQSELPKYVKGSGIEGSDESGNDPLKSNKKLSLSIEKGATEIVVSAKRFKQDDRGNRTKIHNAIKLDDIELPITGDNSGKKVKFEPTAFVVHSGEFGGGHYLAYVKEKDEKGNVSWYEYDDHKVRKISENKNCIPRESVGINVSKAMGLDPEKRVSFLELRKKQAYIVKYSTQNEREEIPLPQRSDDERVGAVNLGNTCWANAAVAFAGSFTSFEKEKGVEKPRPPLQDQRRVDVHSPKVNVGRPDQGKHVRFASQNDVREFDKNAPASIPVQKPVQNQLYKTIISQPNKVQGGGNNLSQMQSLGLEIDPRAIDTQGRRGLTNLVTMGFNKSEAEKKVKKLRDDGINSHVKWRDGDTSYGVQALIPTNNYEAERKGLTANTDKEKEGLKKVIEKNVSQENLEKLRKEFKVDELNLAKFNQSKISFGQGLDKDKKIFSNKLVKALNLLRQSLKDLNNEGAWKNLTTLDRRVLVDYYNQNNDVKIDFQSLYKESQPTQKADLRINSQDYVFDATKIDDLNKVMSYAKESIPKSSIENPVVKRLAENLRTRI